MYKNRQHPTEVECRLFCCPILLGRCRFCSFLKLLSYRHTADPPFLVYLSTERQRGDDTKNRIREIEGSLELYTERKADPDLEKQIEEKVLFDVEFRKYQAQIPQEDTTQTAYDFTITQKK